MNRQPTVAVLDLNGKILPGTLCDIVNEFHTVNATVSPDGGSITFLAARLPGEPRRFELSETDGKTRITAADADSDTVTILGTILAAAGGRLETNGPDGQTVRVETAGSIARNMV